MLLSDIQREAARWGDGALMLLAGPGSGKTRVLASRVARLLANEPAARWRILALTFTTRAADEMRSRIEQLAPDAVGRAVCRHLPCFRMRNSPPVRIPLSAFRRTSKSIQILATVNCCWPKRCAQSTLNLGEPFSKAFPVLDGLRDRLAGPDNCLRLFR